MAAVRILGIDPGTRVVGYGCLEIAAGAPSPIGAATPLAMRGSNVVRIGDHNGGDVCLVECGVLQLGGRTAALPLRLFSLAEQFRALVARFAPHEVALEEAFAGKSVQAALRIGEARGVVLAEAARAGLEAHQYPPARIKRCVTGRGAAGKEAVAAMLRQIVPHGRSRLAAPVPVDATDAVAVAWTRVEERRSPLLTLRRGAGTGD